MATLNRIAMTKELLNVKMHSIKDCQEVIDEIENEVLAGEVRYRFAGQKEKFLKELNDKFEQFDSISNALKIGERQTSFHLVQKGTVWDFLRIWHISYTTNRIFANNTNTFRGQQRIRVHSNE